MLNLSVWISGLWIHTTSINIVLFYNWHIFFWNQAPKN